MRSCFAVLIFLLLQLPGSAQKNNAGDARFVKDQRLADKHKNVIAFYTVQFEEYLPNYPNTYDYKIKDSIL